MVSIDPIAIYSFVFFFFFIRHKNFLKKNKKKNDSLLLYEVDGLLERFCVDMVDPLFFL